MFQKKRWAELYGFITHSNIHPIWAIVSLTHLFMTNEDSKTVRDVAKAREES